MIIGIPKEIKTEEYRVAAVPAIVEMLTQSGHQVIVEAGAGHGIGVSDSEYNEAGARSASTSAKVFEAADLIVKIKEPMPQEYELIRRGQAIFTYFHFAASKALTQAMLDREAVCIAYETIREENGSLPLLTPMSEVAGRMSILEGAKYLERPMGGRGMLLGGVPGVAPANVVVIGGGVAGMNAAKIAAGMGANVIVLDINLDRLRYLDDVLPANVNTLVSNVHSLRLALKEADLVIGAVLRPGARTPVVVTREMIRLMKPNAVLVDIAVDQGGCFETTRPTTHADPVYIEEGILHYCVGNMPGAVACTSTYALTNVTAPYMLQLANKGWRSAMLENQALRKGLNVAYGKIVLPEIAELFGCETYPIETLLSEVH